MGEVKPCPGGGEIQCNLLLQVVDGVETLFIAEFVHEGQLKVFAIEIAAEIQQVGLDVEGGIGAGYGWAMADVYGGAMGFLADLGVGGIDAGGREAPAGAIEIGGGAPEFSAALVALYHIAPKCIFTAEHLGCRIKVALGDGLADAGAADDLAIKCNGGEAVDGEI